MDHNDLIQTLTVVAVLAICAVWIVCRIIKRRKGGNYCASGCADCPLSQKCAQKRPRP